MSGQPSFLSGHNQKQKQKSALTAGLFLVFDTSVFKETHRHVKGQKRKGEKDEELDVDSPL